MGFYKGTYKGSYRENFVLHINKITRIRIVVYVSVLLDVKVISAIDFVPLNYNCISISTEHP